MAATETSSRLMPCARLWSLLLLILAGIPAGGASPAGRDAASERNETLPASLFHHLHLVTSGPAYIADFYYRLFSPRAIFRGDFWGIQGIRGDGVFLLVSTPQGSRPFDLKGAIWHFGWGKVSVGETYQEHLFSEVNWKPPYPTLTEELHVHLRSRDPLAAARWYERVFGAVREETLPEAADGPGPSPPGSAAHQYEGRAEAIVRIDKLRCVIHRTGFDLVSTRLAGGIDHLSFLTPDVKSVAARTRDAGIPTVENRYSLPDVPALMIEGPDKIILELLERPKGPGFWLDR